MSEAPETMGSVASLWRYPVKSMMGEEVNSAHLTERGVLGDRAYALLDTSTGKIASAKNPSKWPAMFRFRSALQDAPAPGATLPAARVMLPGGDTVSTSEPDAPAPQPSALVLSSMRSCAAGRGSPGLASPRRRGRAGDRDAARPARCTGSMLGRAPRRPLRSARRRSRRSPRPR